MHILFCEYFALMNDDTLPSYKSVRPSRCYSPRLEGINRLTELNQNNTTPSDVNTSAHFSEVAHEIVPSVTMYSDTPLNQSQPAYMDFPSHKFLHSAVPWTSALNGQSSIDPDIMSTYLGSIPATISNKLANFSYFTADLKVTVVVQGFSTNYGKMILWFDPAPYNTLPGTAGVNVPLAGTLQRPPQKVRCEHIPHIEIDPSKDCTYELTLKCPTPLGCWSKNLVLGSYRYGYLVFNPLNNGIGATIPTVTFTTYLSLENVKLSTLTFTSTDPIFTDFDSIPIPVQLNVQGPIYRFDNIIYTSSFTSKEQGSKPSDKLSKVSEGLQQLGGIPIIGHYATLGSSIASGVSSVLSWFGFSKPVVTTKGNMLLGYTCDEITTMDGDVHAHTVAARLTNSITIDAASIPFCDPMDQDIEFLANKLFLVKQFTVLPAVAPQTAIGDISLDPSNLFVPDSPALANSYEPTSLYWLTRFYEQYKCDFLVEFEVVSSPLHRASIVIAYFPNIADSSASVTCSQAQAAVKTSTIQISGNSKTMFKIPYSQPQPYLTNAAGVNNNFTTAYGFSNGRLAIYLLNPVVSNGTGPIYINVRMGACNLKMGVPSTNLLTGHTVLFTSSTPVSMPDPTCIPDPTFYTKFFGEEMAHTTKEIASRGTVSGTFVDSVFSTLNFCFHAPFPANPVPSDAVGTGWGRQQNWFDWISIGYVGYKGSTNIHWFPNMSGQAAAQQIRGGLDNGATGQITTYVDPTAAFTSITSSKYGFYTGFGRNQNFFTTKVPYYYKGHFKPIFPAKLTATNFSQLGTIDVQCNVTSSTTQPFRLIVGTSLGDDGQLVGFRGIPLLNIV